MPLRETIRRILETEAAEKAIVAIIVANAIVLGLETYPSAQARLGPLLVALDHIFLGFFTIEIVARIYAHGPRFFRGAWNLFDFAVVAIAWLPATGPFSVLRALRVLRVLRLITTVPSIRRVVNGLLQAIPGVGSIMLLLFLVFYVFSVMATMLYGADFPEWFGSLERSAYTLFQIMTLESWSMGIVRPVMEKHPYAWAFFVPFILVTSFTVLNLFIGIIVNAMQAEHEAELRAEHEERSREIHMLLEEIHALRAEVRRLAACRPETADRDPDAPA